MSMKKMVALATTVLSGTIGLGGVAHAQSTGSQVQEDEIVVTGQMQRRTVDGIISAETAAKARATITQEFIETQSAGQTILATIGNIPGVAFNNNDPYGSAGGDITLRGLDAARVSLTFDGIPLNDTGNYAIFSNQQLDPEYITRANVNMGTTDVDSPTASATGGTINFVTRLPKEEGGLLVQYSNGSYDFDRFITILDIGKLDGIGTSAFAGASYTNYDKFKGPGEIEKKQFNARVYQPIGEGDDFVSVAFHYNENRNNFYRNITLTQFRQGLDNFDNDSVCARPTPVAGTVQNEGSFTQPSGATSCTSYFNLRVNPSNTGNIRVNSRFSLLENLTLTVDPSFQYVLANGGGFGTFSETDNRLQGPTDTGGVDLNGDGDTLDTIALYTPNTTNTRRWGVLSSLIWDVTPDHRLRVNYSWDYGRHRQTGDFGFLGANGDPENVFGGKDGYGRRVLSRDGKSFRGRDRLSFAELNQWSAEYRGDFLDGALTVTVGARAPMFTRELNNYCYQGPATFPATVTSTAVVCTTNLVATTGTGSIGTGASALQAPGRAKIKYSEVLPSLGLSWRPLEDHQFYFSYAEGLSAPRTDQLYAFNRARLATLEPETTQSFDLGWRYRGDGLLASVGVYRNMFDNRIASSRDPLDPTITIDRNIGEVLLQGFDAEVGWQVLENMSVYGSVAYNDATLQDNIVNTRTAGVDGIPGNADDVVTFFNTKGKRLVETPEWTASLRADYEIGDFTFGLNTRWQDFRYFTDVNDPNSKAPGFIVVDLDARWDLTNIIPGTSRTFLQMNATNILNEFYLGNLGTDVTNVNQSHAQGAPRAVMVTLRTEF